MDVFGTVMITVTLCLKKTLIFGIKNAIKIRDMMKK